MYFIEPTAVDIQRGLESWSWAGVGSAEPVLVTTFGDVFLERPDGMWFLDSSLEGELTRVCSTRVELDQTLNTDESRDHFLFAAFVDRAIREGMRLGARECYDFRIHPRIGGKIDFENMEKRDFVVALHLRGQLHDQVRHLKPGTKISKFVLAEDSPKKSRWKFWH